MNTPHAPSPQEVLDQHRALLALTVQALIAGTAHARAYAGWQAEGTVDRFLGPALVRMGAKRFMVAKGQEVNEEEELEFEPEFLANLGLALSAPGIHVRVLKSDHGTVPVPGPSQVRQRFYAQGQGSLFPEAELSSERRLPVVNLVLHWSTDAHYQLERVSLACPKAGELTRASVECYWDTPIWRNRFQETETQREAEMPDLDLGLDDADGRESESSE